MPIYEFKKGSGIARLENTTFAKQGIEERRDIQRLLREQIEIISENTMVIAEEFGSFDASSRRIDLLCLDKEARLVVVELKRTEDGGHMELQAIQYSAFVANMTFDQVVEAHASFLRRLHSDQDNQQSFDARQRILEFLGWEEPDEDSFAQDVRIVLASADFSRELTTSVLWLNDKGIDIRCVKMAPFTVGERILLDVQQVIPFPEAEQYQVGVQQKRQAVKRANARDRSKFTLSVDGQSFSDLTKRKLMYKLVSVLIQKGVVPDELRECIGDQTTAKLFYDYEGNLNAKQFKTKLKQQGKYSLAERLFCKQDELFEVNDRTYAFTNQWGETTERAAEIIITTWPDFNISFERQ